MQLQEDFYIETSDYKKIESMNIGGDYNTFDRLNDYGIFFGTFMVRPGNTLSGHVVFDIPRDSVNVRFVYEEWHFKGDDRTSVKHHYKVKIPFVSPIVFTYGSTAENFESKALDFKYQYSNPADAAKNLDGYLLEIENDYDGFDTIWIGAHRYGRDDTAKDQGIDADPWYTVDFTRDRTMHNAWVEYNNYFKNVQKIGGRAFTAGDRYSTVQYQINISSTHFGIAYRNGQDNYFIGPDDPADENCRIEFVPEIAAFFRYLDIGSVSLWNSVIAEHNRY
jgi:hypothetical protein